MNSNPMFHPFEGMTAYKAILLIKGNPFWLKNIFRFIGAIVLVILVSVAPDMEVVCSITGGVFGTAIIFIFSTFAYNTHFAKSISTFRKLLNYFLMTVLFVFGAGSVMFKIIDGPARR